MLRRATALKRICDRQRVQNAKAITVKFNILFFTDRCYKYYFFVYSFFYYV